MLICDAHRVLFVHVPKTGGISTETLLKRACPDARVHRGGPGQGKHQPLGRILTTEPALADYWSFGFVRNPWARMVSWWTMIDSWHQRVRAFEEGVPDAPPVRSRGVSMWREAATYSGFEEFVMRGTKELRRVGTPQVRYLRAPRHGREVDFIGRTESIVDDLAVVQAKLGLTPETPPHRNRSHARDYRTYYTPETRAKVAEVYAEDIEEFGYSF